MNRSTYADGKNFTNDWSMGRESFGGNICEGIEDVLGRPECSFAIFQIFDEAPFENGASDKVEFYITKAGISRAVRYRN